MTRAAQVLATRSNARESAGPRTLQGKAVAAEDFANACVLDRLRLYERRIEHCLYRTRGELRNQRLREKELATKEGGVVRSTGILPMLRGRLKAGLPTNRVKRTQSTPDQAKAAPRPGRRAKRYRVKRSQFPPSTGAGGDGRGRRRGRRPAHCANEPNLSPRRWAGPDAPPMLGAIVPNEANLPFDSSGRGCREVGGGVVVVTACTNEPNFRAGAGMSVDRPSRPSRPRWSPNVSNEANPAGAMEWASALWEKSYDELGLPRASGEHRRFSGQADAVSLESATVCRAHPTWSVRLNFVGPVLTLCCSFGSAQGGFRAAGSGGSLKRSLGMAGPKQGSVRCSRPTIPKAFRP